MNDKKTKLNGHYGLLWLILLVVVILMVGRNKRNQLELLPMETQDPPVTAPVDSDGTAESKYDISKGMMDIIRNGKSWEAIGPNYYGKPAPELILTDINGTQHKLSDYKGKEVMIAIWATWCPPCRAEIPHLKELTKKRPADKFKLLAISSEDGGTGVVRQFAQKNKLNYTTIWTDHYKLPEPFIHASVLPSAFFINKDGNIKLITQGLMDKKSIEAILDES